MGAGCGLLALLLAAFIAVGVLSVATSSDVSVEATAAPMVVTPIPS